jgi:L-ascorbate metabolism protein UlaG (beta-lactamase superfamily)
VKVTKFGHSCLLVEDGDARLLLDPGTFSAGFEDLTGLTAVLVTHQHPDHLDRDKLPGLLERNPDARLHTDPDTAAQLADAGIEAAATRAGDTLDLGTEVRVFGRDHAVIHPDIPIVSNTGYLVGGRLFHPGDAFTVPDAEVEILGLPTAAPWQKVSEAIDYLRAVAPRVAIPIHEKIVAVPGMYYARFTQLGPAGTEVRVVDDGTSTDV